MSFCACILVNCVKFSGDSVWRASYQVARVSVSDVLLGVLRAGVFVISLAWEESCKCSTVFVGRPPPKWEPSGGGKDVVRESSLSGLVLIVGCE